MACLICPQCNVGMTPVRRSEVEIDVCPQCRGVWLDRGELEKLLDALTQQLEPAPGFLPADPAASPWSRAQSADVPPPAEQDGHYQGYGHRDGHGHHQGHHDRHGEHGRNHSKGWRGLLEIFD